MNNYFSPLISLFFVPMRLDFLNRKNPAPAPKQKKGFTDWNDDTLRYDHKIKSYVSGEVYNAPLKTTKKKGNFFGGKTGGLGKIFGKVLSKSKLTAPAPQSAPQPAPQAPQPAPQAPPPAVTPQAQTESKMTYKNPANITTEYSPFGKPLAAIAPVVLPENYQEPKKASISTSGIAAIGAALLAGLL